jgi:hypothetical protein
MDLAIAIFVPKLFGIIAQVLPIPVDSIYMTSNGGNMDIKKIAKAVGYRGRNIKLEKFRPGMSLNSYWDGGSRDYFYFVDIASGQVVNTVRQNGTPFDRLDLKADRLEPGQVLVEVSIFRGKAVRCSIYQGE